ncbi:YkvA family protein [Streptomyces syringium]|uniref:YkvA family protein n=1 Tax=Streptomyces syringium TaxID=76729 RepID=UPI0034554D35
MSSESWALVSLLAVLVTAMAVAAAVVAVRLFRARRLLRDAGVPENKKIIFWGALLYLVSPVDLVPDPVYLDDIGILLFALRSLHKAAAGAGAGRARDK